MEHWKLIIKGKFGEKQRCGCPCCIVFLEHLTSESFHLLLVNKFPVTDNLSFSIQKTLVQEKQVVKIFTYPQPRSQVSIFPVRYPVDVTLLFMSNSWWINICIMFSLTGSYPFNIHIPLCITAFLLFEWYDKKYLLVISTIYFVPDK